MTLPQKREMFLHFITSRSKSTKYRSLPTRSKRAIKFIGLMLLRFMWLFLFLFPITRWNKWQFEACRRANAKKHKICNMTKHKTLKCNLFIRLFLSSAPPPSPSSTIIILMSTRRTKKDFFICLRFREWN